ncbi:hypothetical protein HZQ13_04520 [Elizabethkingia anophelis]|nr:hypothetical protein [Elizabethkingia anophelis]
MNDTVDFFKDINFAILFTIVASISVAISSLLKSKKELNKIYNDKSEKNKTTTLILNKKIGGKPLVLKFFAIVIVCYIVILIFLKWDIIKISKDNILLYSGLFLMMCFGMFVSVIRRNYKKGKNLFDVKDSDLIYPTLFSVLVFYPLLVLVDTESNLQLVIYTAFLNGFFWKTFVAEEEEDNKD